MQALEIGIESCSMQLLAHTAPRTTTMSSNGRRRKRRKDVRRREEGNIKTRLDGERCGICSLALTFHSLQRIEAEKERRRQHQLDLQNYKETYVGSEGLREPLPTVMQVESHGEPFGPERVRFSRIFVCKGIFAVI